MQPNYPKLPASFEDSSTLLFYEVDKIKEFGLESIMRSALTPDLSSIYSGFQEALIFSKDIMSEEFCTNEKPINAKTLAWASLHKLKVEVVAPTRQELDRIYNWLGGILADAEKGEAKRAEIKALRDTNGDKQDTTKKDVCPPQHSNAIGTKNSL